MSPVPSNVRVLKLVVPRHGAQRPGAALAQTIESVARAQKKKQRVRVDVRNGHPRRLSSSEGSNPLAAAIESASEWNSLLITARAERGPQWDVATQQFVVDEGSELYYDPSPLRPPEPEKPEVIKDARRGRAPSLATGHHPMHAVPPMHRQPSMASVHSPAVPHPGAQHYDPRFGPPPPGMGGYNPGMGLGPNSVPPGQFYGGPPPGQQVKQMHHDGIQDPMAFSPMHDQRRMTRGMSGMGMGDGFVPPGMYGT